MSTRVTSYMPGGRFLVAGARYVADRLPLELYLAGRYLLAHSKSRVLNLITIIAVCLGVTALIIVIALMSGLQREVRDRILGTNPHITVLIRGTGLRIDNWREPLVVAEADDAVTFAEPFIYSEALIFENVNYQQGVALRGIAPEAVTHLADQLYAGSWDFESANSGLPGIVLGFRLADRLLVSEGDTISLVSGHGAELTPAGFLPKFKKFTVVGLFKSGMFEYDNQMGYVSLEAAQDLVGLDDAVSGLALWVEDPWRVGEVADRLQAELGYPYVLRDWKSMNEGLFSALKLEKVGMALVLLLLVVVAAVNIVATLIMVVTDKTREIGILRAMGMRANEILRVFVLQGLIIGVTGTLLGFAFGLTSCLLLDRSGLMSLPGDVYLISEIPMTPDPLDLGIIVICSILISFTATIYPSRWAARLAPVEAIRHE